MTARFRNVTAALLAVPLVAFADNRGEILDDLLQRYNELGQFNGVALIADGDTILLRKGYGFADFEKRSDNSPALQFLAGSITKSVTALVALQLEHQGKLDLDAKVSDYLPEYRDDTGSQLTLRHLLAHTDGLPNYTWDSGFWEPWENGAPLSTRQFIDKFCSGDLDFEPGSEYRNGNSGFSVLGAIIETVTGMTFAEAVRKQVLEPFGLRDSGVHRNERPPERIATGYEVSVDGYRRASPVYKPLFAAGSMYWTVDDLRTYRRALSNDTLVAAAIREQLFDIRKGAVDATFAYGWNVGRMSLDDTIPATRYTATNGEINGFNAILVHIPSNEHFLVLLNNTGETNLPGIAANVLRVMYGLTAETPTATIRDVFLAKFRDDSIAAAQDYYRQQREVNPDDSLFMSWPLRIFAAQLIESKRYAEARVLLDLNLETNPSDARSLTMLKSIDGNN